MRLDLITDPRLPEWLRTAVRSTSIEAELLSVSGYSLARSVQLEERARILGEIAVRCVLGSPIGSQVLSQTTSSGAQPRRQTAVIAYATVLAMGIGVIWNLKRLERNRA